MTLTERQARELDYHVEHAKAHKPKVDFGVVTSKKRRWWNAYWSTWTFINSLDLKNKRVLVVGCGDGVDALYFAYSGAKVDAFDLSPDMLEIARQTAAEHRLPVTFREAPAEAMPYGDNRFDVIYARDILHHVEIPQTMREITRVAKPGALMIVNEIYSHSITDKVRYSKPVDKWLYPLMRRFIYGSETPYITEDERKMTEKDIQVVSSHVSVRWTRYYNFLVTRIVPDGISLFSRADRIMLALTAGLGRYLAGRIVMAANIKV